MDKPTHLVVGVAEDSSQLRQARILGELKAGMEIIAWTTNASDAEIVRRTFQELNSDRAYFVMVNKGG